MSTGSGGVSAEKFIEGITRRMTGVADDVGKAIRGKEYPEIRSALLQVQSFLRQAIPVLSGASTGKNRPSGR